MSEISTAHENASLATAEKTCRKDPISCLAVCERILADTPEDLYGAREFQALFLKARTEWLLGSLSDARNSSTRLLELATGPKQALFKAKALNLIGNLAYDSGRNGEALDSYLQALAFVDKTSTKSDSTHMHSAILNNIGEVYKAVHLETEALESYDRALELATAIGSLDLAAIVMLNKGEVFASIGRLKESEECVRSAERHFKENDNVINLISSHCLLGNLLSKRGSFDDAESLYIDAYELCLATSVNPTVTMKILHALGDFYFMRNRFKDALICTDRALNLSKNLPQWAVEADILHLQSRLHEKEGNFKSALETLKSHVSIKNRLWDLEKKNTFRNIKTQIQLHHSEEEKKAVHQWAMELDQKNKELELLSEKLNEMKNLFRSISLKDPLTGIPNRRYFFSVFRRELARAQRDKSPISLVIMDVDYFKEFNDHHGHLSGDRCLARIAEAVQQNLQRKVDLFARFGGDEFVLLLPKTDKSGAAILLERLFSVIRSLRIEHAGCPHAAYVTLTAGGISLIPSVSDTADGLFSMADKVLYQSKRLKRGTCRIDQIPG